MRTSIVFISIDSIHKIQRDKGVQRSSYMMDSSSEKFWRLLFSTLKIERGKGLVLCFSISFPSTQLDQNAFLDGREVYKILGGMQGGSVCFELHTLFGNVADVTIVRRLVAGSRCTFPSASASCGYHEM